MYRFMMHRCLTRGIASLRSFTPRPLLTSCLLTTPCIS
jgi:hypothetical protein